MRTLQRNTLHCYYNEHRYRRSPNTLYNLFALNSSTCNCESVFHSGFAVCRCHHYISLEVHVKSWPTGYNSQKILLIWGLSLRGRWPNFFMRCKWKYLVSENLKQKILGGHLVFLIFFSREGGEQAFVVVIKHLIDFDGNKLSRHSGWVCFFIP